MVTKHFLNGTILQVNYPNVGKQPKYHRSGQITIIPKPEFVGDFGGISLTKAPFKVTSAEVAIICPNR